MTAITLRFTGVYEKILDALISSGLAKTKTEAIRFALFNTAIECGVISDKITLKTLQAEFQKKPISIEEVLGGIEDAKAAVRR
ncbi:hypothetical protein HZC09_05505 [Candidatus Micrarchaeota archaeon]|nr:hypothetical protein [Candidatus Micrarchaeota archaeon]